MRTPKSLLFILVALLGAAVTGCAGSGTSRATGQVVDDASITARVKTALARDAGLGKSLDVNVTTYEGNVQLSGFVESRELAERAGQIARGVEGVRSVQNDIRITGAADRGSSAGAGSGGGGEGGRGAGSGSQ